MTISNPASFSSIRTEAGTTNANFANFYRSGPVIAANWAAQISTTANGLAMSQFSGVTKPSTAVTSSISPNGGTWSSSGTGSTKTITSGTLTAAGGGGNGTFTYAWSIVSSSGCTSPAISNNTAAAITVSASVYCAPNIDGTASATGVINLQCVVTSGGVTSTSTCTVNLVNYNTYANSCVTVATMLASGIRAGLAQTGMTTRVTDPYANIQNNTQDGEILYSQTRLAECVRLELANGGWLDCSMSAPIPTKDHGYVTPQMGLQGKSIPMAHQSQLDQETIEFTWIEIVNVVPLGLQEVQHLYIADQNFWASGDGVWYVLHHNLKPIAPP